MAANKIRRISLCGGEPFLFHDIIEIVAYAGRKKIQCSITSNGMTAHRLSESELNVLKECKTEINISIDSFQNSIQSYTRGTPEALPNALKSVRRLTEKHIPVTVLTAISKYNYHDLFNFFTKAWEKGIKQVLFQPIIYYSNYPERPAIENKSQLNVGVDEIDKLMDELRKILRFEKTHNINTNVYRMMPWIEHYLRTAASENRNWFFKVVLKKFYCRDVYSIIDITYFGGIQSCCLASAKTSIYNNRHQGLIKLWLKANRELRNDLENERYREYCNGCCHHFSRNMLASIMKYPVQNRAALMKITPLVVSRLISGMLKKFYIWK